MTDEELTKILDRREERLRHQLETERTERRYERFKKLNDLTNRIGVGILIFLFVTLWSALVTQCEVGREIDRIKEVTKAK